MKNPRRIISRHEVCAKEQTGKTCTFAFLADLHNGPFEDILPLLDEVDAVLFAGDLIDRHREGVEPARRFLRQVPGRVPVFFSLGNHETRSPEGPAFVKVMRGTEHVTVLEDAYVSFKGLILGGVSSRERDSHRLAPEEIPGICSFVDSMAAEEGFHILLCHHPEYYMPCIRGRGIELTLSGHAHGGQVQIFGQGLYAPGQGILPKFTHGFYDDRHLLVSRGMTNGASAPRWGNPCELILLTLRY